MAKKSLEQAAIETEIQETAVKEIMAVKENEIEAAEAARSENIREEREQLVGEAYRLQGRVEAFNTIAKFADVGTLLTLKAIKEGKIYKNMADVGTWDEYCKSIGMSRSKIDEDLANLETFGADFMDQAGKYGLGYRELRRLKKAASEGTLAVDGDAVNIGGETIPLNDKDELKDALERVIAAKDKEIEAHAKNKDRLIKEKQRAYDEADENRRLLNEAKTELEKLKTASVGGISPADRPAYNNIKACEDKLAVVHKNLLETADGELSEFNQQLLGGVVMMMFQVAEDLRLALAAKGGAYFDRLYLTDKEIAACDNMLRPSKLNRNAGETGTDVSAQAYETEIADKTAGRI